MKISSAVVTIENVFDRLNINFLETESSSIHYLVGNNGAGKTHLLEALHSCIGAQQLGRTGSVELRFDNGKNSLHCEWNGSNNMRPGKITGVALTDTEEQNFRKSVYSNVEINFANSDIKSTSAESIDDEIPNERSTNLNAIIPQLLINLRQQDSNLRSDWMANNVGSRVPDWIEGQKLERFTSAYDRIFQGEKQYRGIVEDNGKYSIEFVDAENNIVDLADLSSGEKQIIFRLGFILKNLETLKDGFIFIDEPEISLHPSWQLRFKALLLEIFRDSKVQIFIATHSPYIFGDMNPDIEECININRLNNSAEKIDFPLSAISTSPSMNLVNFLAYGIASKELHIELYNEIQIKSGESTIPGIDTWLESKGLTKENRSVTGASTFQKNDGSASTRTSSETITTWIRNKMHHSDLMDRQNFCDGDLESSIRKMLSLL